MKHGKFLDKEGTGEYLSSLKEYLNNNVFDKIPSSANSNNKLTDKIMLIQKVPDAHPQIDGTYVLKCVVLNGTPTYQWVLES